MVAGARQLSAVRSFRPQQISGLKLLFQPKLVTGVSDGATLPYANLIDQSGVGNHPTSMTNTPIYEATTGQSSTPCIKFNGGHYYVMPNVMSGASAGHAMYWFKCDNTHWQGGMTWGTHGDSNHWFFSGSIYDGFGSNTRKGPISQSFGSSWVLVSTWSAASDWGLKINGTAISTTSSNTVGWNATPVFGQNQSASTLYHRYGAFAMFNKKLSTNEEAQMTSWLTANPGG